MGFVITKETRFSELPLEMKQKIVNIYKYSHQHYGSTEPLKPTRFNYLYSQTQDLQTRNLKKNLDMIVRNAEILKRIWNQGRGGGDFKYLYNKLKEGLEEFQEDIELYKKNEGNTEFIDEIVLTYSMLENKLESILREKKSNKS